MLSCTEDVYCTGVQPHKHDRLHRLDSVLPFCVHHAIAPWMGGILTDAGPQLPGLLDVQPHRGAPLVALARGPSLPPARQEGIIVALRLYSIPSASY